MEVKLPKKYNKSQLNGKLIKHLEVDDEEFSVVIETACGERKEYFLDENTAQCSADYILCDLQNNTELKISKY